MILITTDPNWYHNLHSHEGPLLDLHAITHFKTYTITYDEPTIPPELQIKPRIESRDIQVLCIHHKTSPHGMREYARHMDILGTTLQIPTIFNTIVPPTSLNTPVNRNKKWSQLTYMPPVKRDRSFYLFYLSMPPPPTTQTTNIPLINNQNICLPLKYQPQFCYYTDGSFIPPQSNNPKTLEVRKKNRLWDI